MKTALNVLAAACTGSLLLACAVPLRQEPSAPIAGSAAPVVEVADGIETRNRAATDLAEQGELRRAIAVWEQLAAAATTPQNAYLLRNLGYAYFLKGDFETALTTLGKACLLDPLNARGWRHLGSVFEKIGQDERAQLMFRQAASLEQHDLKADVAHMPGVANAAIAGAVAAPPAPLAQEWLGMRVLDPSSGVVDLPRMEEGGAASASAVLLEIRNGNGIRGMAADTARTVDSRSVHVVRLSNEKGFNVASTRVEYEGPYRVPAARLAQQFAAALVQVESCRSADMRLVIGKDLARSRRAPRPRT
ncbi:tetratricopeptide repeat protein [Massilia arenosa]|uniref:Tetratricopeptide repeat protein n=1 Tax=Zemynaea arenosa TaxID=2561931 RepID=A0A4Y9S6V6_9BURK|nr:tetratricopeptide repeat protein [Massilia arenosa]TFW17150.1 tetratricopeptide repeat protein [Massilia arenosa]